MSKRTDYLFRAHKIRGMNTVTKMVLCTLADQANDKGESWHGHESLADLCGCSRRSVIRHLEKLEALGFVRITNRSADGIKTSNLYTLNINAFPDVTQSHIDMTGGHNDVTQSHIDMTGGHNDVTQSPLRCDSLSKPRDRESHKTPIKHSVKLLGGGGDTRKTSIAEDLADHSWAY